MTQRNLWDAPTITANGPGLVRAAAPATSRAAAESIAQVTGELRTRIYAWIARRGRVGATCDEVELELELPHQTASARLNELVRGGFVKIAGTRPTRSGRAARVHVAGGDA